MNITDIQKKQEEAKKDLEMEAFKNIQDMVNLDSTSKDEPQYLEVDPEAAFLLEMKDLEETIYRAFKEAVKDKNTNESRMQTLYAMVALYEKFLTCRKNTYFTDKAKFKIS